MCDIFRRGSWPWRNSTPRFPSRLRGTRTTLWRKRTIFRWCYSRYVWVILLHSHATLPFRPVIESCYWCLWVITDFLVFPRKKRISPTWRRNILSSLGHWVSLSVLSVWRRYVWQNCVFYVNLRQIFSWHPLLDCTCVMGLSTSTMCGCPKRLL